MMKRFRPSVGLVLLLSLLFLPSAFAIAFPDVALNYSFSIAISQLSDRGVIGGNPDGFFRPHDPVNRAAMLKMLSLAAKKTPSASGGCFSDVPQGSWFESYVCDAAAKENGFVQGYADGKFRPANPVTRTEALKMTLNVFGLVVGDISSADQDVIKFADISVSAWYSKYVSASYKYLLLPITGIGGARFYPDQPLTRGEAAAIIFNAQAASALQKTNSSASSASTKAADPAIIKNVVFPFTDTDQFQGRKPVSYAFTLKEKTIVSVHVQTNGTTNSDVSCRLYLFNEAGFSDEYYLGVQELNRCTMTVAASPGSYHLQIQPTTPGVPYFVEAKAGNSDGNDGFSEAVKLSASASIEGTLEASDLYDWYTFDVQSSRLGTVFVSSSERLDCTIYPGPTVDVFGFTGPECGLEYLFQAGTYVVGIGRKGGSDTSKAVKYTVHWK